MNHPWMYWSLLATQLVLVGCAGPRYQTISHYFPPADPQGRACVERCSQVLQACQDRCRVAHQACLVEAEPAAQAHADRLVERYEADLSRYRSAAWGCGPTIGLGWGYYGRHYHGRDLWSVGSHWYLPWGGPWYDPWYGCYAGPPPRAPDRAEEVRRYLWRACTQDCGCQLEYDSCFLACGGRKTVEWECISNCPEGGD